VLLKRVLDRYKRIELNEVPNDPESEPYTLLADAAGSIVVAPVIDDESGLRAWRVTKESVESARALWDVYRDHSIVVGVEDNTPTVFSLAVRDYVGDSFPFLLQRAFILENWQWLGLFAIIFAGMALSRFIAWLMVLTIRRWFRSEHLELDKKLERDFVRPVRIALMAWVWLLGLTVLGLPANILYYLGEGAKVVSAAAGLWAVYRLVDIIFDFATHRASRTPSKYDDILVALVGRSLKLFVIAVGFIIILSIFGWDYKSVLAGLGLGGLAFALAAKDTVSNFFGSLTVVLDRPFSIGDWVNIDGIEGTVETVGIRSTRIRTFYNSLISVPNANLINTAIDNYGARRYRRIKTTLSLTYDTPPEKIETFCEGVREIIRQHPYTRKDYYHVYFNDYSAASLDIMLYCFVETPDWSTELRERERLLLDVLRLAKDLDVEFAFPTQTLYIRNDEAPTHDSPRNGSRRENFVEGRQTATGVVRQSYGDPSRRPPPVSFTHPDGIESDLK
jgi:MscS family membrane protein